MTLTPGTRLAAFAVVLAAALGGGALLGGAVGPIDTGSGPPATHMAPTPAHEGHGP